MSVRGKCDITDKPLEGEGRLCINLNEGEHIIIGKTRIHLSHIACSGHNGGKRSVALVLVGPKDAGVKRSKVET